MQPNIDDRIKMTTHSSSRFSTLERGTFFVFVDGQLYYWTLHVWHYNEKLSYAIINIDLHKCFENLISHLYSINNMNRASLLSKSRVTWERSTYTCQVCFVECVSTMKPILTIVLHASNGDLCHQLTHFSSDYHDNIWTWFNHHLQIGNIIH